ncbi:MAG: MBL fold metallo-hydrolase [Clostridia bacterium]|nr:MBL fold metallo-hydrolase [Clostridia bacterium]
MKTNYKRIKYKFGKNKKLDVLVIVIMLCAVAFGIYNYIREQQSMLAASSMEDGECEIHMIDVGQGDAVLIRTSEGNVLIDSGSADAEYELLDYLNSQGVVEIEYAVFTHPHEDHIGNGDVVLENYKVKNVIMPDVQADTRCFEDLLLGIDDEGSELITAHPGDTYTVGGLTLNIFAPIECDPDNLNNCSIVMRVDYGETSMLFSGDAEKAAELEVYERYGNELDCDIYKVAHHGSSTSNCDEFFSAASPDLALISCGIGNSYGHPHREIVDMLNEKGITVRRTDVDGNVVVATDGEKYWLKEE